MKARDEKLLTDYTAANARRDAMTQHTPGPWRVGDAGRTVFGPPNGNPSPETIAHGIARRNARLIAAAPEMLECLRLIIEGGTYNDDGDFVLTHEPAVSKDEDYLDAPEITQARTLLAKIDGKEG